MFKINARLMATDDEGSGGGGSGGGAQGGKGALDGRREGGGGGGAAAAVVTPADARTFLTEYAQDPAALAAMKDEDVVKYHGRVKGGLDKATGAALSAAAFKLEQRPEWLPEAFYDPAAKTIKHEAMVKSWKETSGQLRTLQGAKGAPPEKADLYAFERPKDLPAHILAGDMGKDESLKLLRETAHEAGMSQEQFAKFATGYYGRASKLLPPPVDGKAELAKLGENGEKVADTVINWLEGFQSSGLLNDAEVDALIMQGATADGIRGLNKVREHFGGLRIPVTASVDNLPSKDELYKMTADDRYTGKGGKGDEAFRAEVKKKFEQVFGTAPAGTSEAGRV